MHQEMSTSNAPQAYLNSVYEKTRSSPSPECPPGNDPTKIEQTYDGMVLQLLAQVIEGAKEKTNGLTGDEKQQKLQKALVDGMQGHITALKEHIAKDEKELKFEEAEQKKHITSDDLHDGFDSTVRLLLTFIRLRVLRMPT